MLQLHVILHFPQNAPRLDSTLGSLALEACAIYKTGLLRDMSPRTDLSVVYDRDTVYSSTVHTFIRHMYLSNANAVHI